jgi:hypothetical protein
LALDEFQRRGACTAGVVEFGLQLGLERRELILALFVGFLILRLGRVDSSAPHLACSL